MSTLPSPNPPIQLHLASCLFHQHVPASHVATSTRSFMQLHAAICWSFMCHGASRTDRAGSIFSDHIAWSQREPPGLRTTIINGCPWIIIHGSPWISMDTFGYPKGSQPGPMGGELLGAQVIPQNGGGVGWGDVGPSGVRVGLIDN